LKRRFRNLLLAPEYDLEVQARIPAALAAIHNFISVHSPHDKPISSTTSDHARVRMYDDADEDFGGELDDVDLRRDRIAQKMWDDYILLREYLAERGIDSELESEDASESESEGEDGLL
jgi:hypothetical protein